MSKYDKKYFERYALLSICYLRNLEINKFEHKDRPDLQSNAYNVGIEVVRAITSHDGLTNSLVNTYFGKGLSGEEIVNSIQKNNEKHKKFKGSACTVNGVAVISNTKGLYDAKKHRMLIVEKIKEKARLFQDYKHFETNGLYCFAETGLIDDVDYPDIITACNDSPFDVIFINEIDSILQWENQSNRLTKHEIPNRLLSEWKQASQNKFET